MNSVATLDWPELVTHLDRDGYVVIPRLISPAECARLIGAYDDPARYRSTITMARYGFGRGEYKYFSYPLPVALADLRAALYEKLAPIANRWNEQLGVDARYPDELAEFTTRCHTAGQVRPTPLILKYGPGDFNCLHQDLYGDLVFPLQVAILLSQPGESFTGGEFVLTQRAARQQSRAEVVPLQRGDGVLFAVNARPEAGARGVRKVSMRHGVSRVTSGQRYTAGVIFHDAP